METTPLKYDTPVEVSKDAFKTIMNRFGGICAGMEENGRYYIKLWIMAYRKGIESIINTNPLTK